MATPTVEVLCTEDLERALKRCAAHAYLRGEEFREFQILTQEVVRARAMQRYNDDRQIRLQLPAVG